MRRRAALLLALAAAPARAAGPPAGPVAPGVRREAPTFEDWLADLGGSDAPDRLLAARELRRMVRVALRQARSRDELVRAEGLALLEQFDAQLAPACIAALEHDNVRRPCADILGMLETPEARDPLRAALAGEERRGVRRHIERAIAAIEAAGSGQGAGEAP